MNNRENAVLKCFCCYFFATFSLLLHNSDQIPQTLLLKSALSDQKLLRALLFFYSFNSIKCIDLLNSIKHPIQKEWICVRNT